MPRRLPSFSVLACLAPLAAGAVVFCLGGCSKQQAPEPEVVLARVGDTEITQPEFAQLIKARRELSPVPIDPQAFLQELVDREVLVQNAVRAGLQDDPKVRELIRDVLIARLKEQQLNPKLEGVAVSDEELRAEYERDKPNLMTPERVRLAMLFISVPAEADAEVVQDAHRRLQAAAAMTSGQRSQEGEMSAQAFGPIAVNYSEDQESRYRGGEIGWVEREKFPPRLDRAVVEAGFALKSPGQISDVVTGRDGVYLVKLLERKPSAAMPLDQAEPALRRRLLHSKQERVLAEFQTSLRTGLQVEVYPDQLERVQAAVPEATPPSPSIP